MDKNQIREYFPMLSEIELLEEISEHSIERIFRPGENIIRKGEYLKYMPLVFSGSVKVMREDEKGNEVLLYFLEGGHTCAMSITCCMKEEKSNIWATAEDESTLLLIPIIYTEQWSKKYSSWRNFIMNSYAQRMEELLHVIDSISFQSLDERLINYLHERSKVLKKDEFEITHSTIAKELNSSREAISRLLKKLENMGQVKLGRNKIKMMEP